MEKKIFLEKNDGLEVAVEQLINAKSDVVVLNIPKDSVLGRSVNNFHVLKRESGTAGKALMIESIDDHILELASIATITAINPVFKKNERAVSDIVPRAAAILKKNPFVLQHHENKEEREISNEEIVRDDKKTNVPPVTFYIKKEREGGDLTESGAKGKKKGVAIIVSVIIFFIVSISVYLGWFLLPSASIEITMRQKNVDFNEIVEASNSIAKTQIDSARIVLRGQLVSSTGNLSLPISGVKKTEGSATKAQGVITIMNVFGTNSQKLVATTRFQSPEGKIFRITKDVVVPGGSMVGGKLKAGTINADVVADEVGGSYNLGPIEKWTIPGFKDTPKFQGFYGVSSSSMVGGSDGLSITVSSSTEGETEDSVIEKLKISLEEKKKILDTVGLKVLPGATLFSVTKKDIQISSSGDATMYVEGSLKEIGFNEDDLHSAVVERTAEKVDKSMKMRSINIEYETSTPNFSSGVLNFRAKGNVVFEESIDLDSIKESVAGKKMDEVRTFILGLPGVESAKISLSFPWLVSIPRDINRLTILVK